MSKDWTGNKKSAFSTLGASSHSEHEREIRDYYATDPKVINFLLRKENLNHKIWENACGECHLSNRLKEKGFEVYSTDIVDRGCVDEVIDFLNCDTKWDGDILTNPPYKYAQEFVEKSIEAINNGNKVYMFLKLTFLEGQRRKEMFKKYPPKTVYVFSARQKCAKNGDFENADSSAVAYAWFVWERGFNGKSIIEWI